MKKIFNLFVLLFIAFMTVACASKQTVEIKEFQHNEPFVRNYKILRREYSVTEYKDRRYRSNFKSIPQEELIDTGDGAKMGLFLLDNNPLILVFMTSKDGSGSYLTLFDPTPTEYISENFWKKNNNIWKGRGNDEASSFRYTKNSGSGIVSEIEINGKKYVIAIAGRNSNTDGFRMWLEDSLPTDQADTAIDSSGLVNYDYIDIFEGIYKPGYKRLWGKSAPEYLDWYDMKDFKVYKYNYNGVDFVVGGNQSLQNSVLTMDRKPLEPETKEYFKIMSGPEEKRNMGMGYCYEGEVTIGDKKVTMALIQCDGDTRIFIKE